MAAPRPGDVALATVLTAGALWEALVGPLSPPGYVGRAWVATLGSVLVVLPVLGRSRHPIVYAAAVTAGTTLLWTQARGQGELPFVGYSSSLVATYALGAYLPLRTAVTAASVTLAAWGLPDVVDVAAGVPSVHQDMGFFVLVGLSCAAGAGIRALRAQSAALHDALDQLAAERAAREEQAVREERRRIARDMHDVLTHTASALAVQAGALRVRLAGGPEEATARGIEDAARASLRELRQLLGLLREDVDRLAPSPGIEEIAALAAPLRSTGVAVQVRLEGPWDDVPAGPALVAYRVAQESLTNVAKHASAACRVEIRVTRMEGRLEVEVRDDGAARPAPPGLGLRGMQERVAAYGGRLVAGPHSAGPGWHVQAVLPL